MRAAGNKRFAVRKRYPWKFFEQNVIVAYFKNQPPEVFCKKVLLKSSQFHRKIPVLEPLFNKFADMRAWGFHKKRLQQINFSSEISEIFESTYFEVHLWTSASVYS